MLHLLSLTLMASLHFAATGPASLSCKPAGKKDGLTLRGLIPATQNTLELSLSSGTGTLTLRTDGGDQGHVVEAFGDKVFTLTVTRKEGDGLVLYAIPRSIKVRREPFAVHATFDAVAVTAPAPGSAASITNTRLACLYDYEV